MKYVLTPLACALALSFRLTPPPQLTSKTSSTVPARRSSCRISTTTTTSGLIPFLIWVPGMGICCRTGRRPRADFPA